MPRVVGAKLQSIQQARHHAAVVGAVRIAHDHLHLLAVGRAGGLPFLHDVTQRLLVDDRIDDILDDAIGLGESGFGQLKQQAVLAGHPLQVLEQFAFDPPFGPGTDAMDSVQKQVDQRVCEFALAEVTEDGQQRQPQWRRVTPQFIGCFDGQPLPVALEDLGRDALEQLGRQAEGPNPVQLGDLPQEAFQARRAGVGKQLDDRGPARLRVGMGSAGRRWIGDEQRFQALTGLR